VLATRAACTAGVASSTGVRQLLDDSRDPRAGRS
jgi:hypothetical protein